MMKKAAYFFCAASTLALGSTGAANAQAVNPGITSLPDGLFTLNVNIVRNNAQLVNDTFTQQDFGEGEDFLRFSALRARYGANYTGFEAVRGTLNIRGVPIVASFAQGSGVLVVQAPDIADEGCRSFTPPPTCTGLRGGFIVIGPTQAETNVPVTALRDRSVDRLGDYFDGLTETDALDFLERLFQAMARRSPVDPIAGNPDSVQGRLVEQALDLSQSDSLVETFQPNAKLGETPWIVGVEGGFSTGGVFDGNQVSARLQKGWRLFAGNRARLNFDVPVTYGETAGARMASVQAAASIEYPIIEGRWSLEPRIAYGAAIAPEAFSIGHMAATSITSRLRFNGVGRGSVTVGNMIGYTTMLGFKSEDAGVDFTPELSNVAFRNGVAYDYPIKLQMAGRAASIRASLTHTNMTGDKLFLESYTDAAVSFGVRGREGTPRARSDLFRIGLNGTFGEDYRSTNITMGFRF